MHGLLETLGELLDGIQVAMCVFDPSDRALLWNRSFFQFFPEHEGRVYAGEPYRDNLRRFYSGRLSAEELPKIEAHIEAGVARHRSQNRPYQFEHLGRRIQVASLALGEIGRIRIWRADAVGSGAEDAVRVLLANVTKDALARDTHLLNQVPDGLMICGQDGCIEWVNEPFVVMYDLPDSKMAVGIKFETVFRWCWLRAQIDTAETERFEAGLNILQDNLLFSGMPFELPLPRQRYCRVIARATAAGEAFYAHVDISELKRQQHQLELAERAARESEAQLRHKSALLEATLENMEQGVAMINADGIVEVSNRRTLELLNMPPHWFGTRPHIRDIARFLWQRGEFEDAPEDIRQYVKNGTGSESGFHSYQRRSVDGRILEVRTVPIQGGGVLRTFTDITQRKQDEDRIRHAANHDGLTGLINRSMFMDCLAAEVSQTRRAAAGCAVLFMDLDRFKPVNDQYGHAAGDQVLVWFARQLQQIAREADFVARLGGDEFAVLQRRVDSREQALSLSQRIARALEQTIAIGTIKVQIGVSIGIALCPDDADGADALLRHADLDMYAAKASRRGQGASSAATLSADHAVADRIDQPAQQTGRVQADGGT